MFDERHFKIEVDIFSIEMYIKEFPTWQETFNKSKFH